MTEDLTDITPPHSLPAESLTFRKRERLHHRNAVTRLFEQGKSEYAYPLRMFWLTLSRRQMKEMFRGEIPAGVDVLQMMVTVPKKKFKHAVDRVWLRRRIREAYRLNRLALKAKIEGGNTGDEDTDRFMLLAFIYVGGEKRDFAAIEKKMLKLLDKAATLLDGKEDKTPTPAAEADKPQSDVKA